VTTKLLQFIDKNINKKWTYLGNERELSCAVLSCHIHIIHADVDKFELVIIPQ